MGYHATAQILIGNPIVSKMDRFIPYFVIYLAENSRPSYTLHAMSINHDDAPNFNQVIWIPTIEKTLEYALLMIVLYLHKDQTFIKEAEKYFNLSNRVECYNIPEKGRKALYRLLDNYEFKDYIVISVFKGSLLTYQIQRLKQYQIDGEICLSQRLKE